MSGERYIKQALIAALCEHPDMEKYKARVFSGPNLNEVMEAVAEQRNRLSKADFLSPDDEGKYIIDVPGFWKNFDKVLELVGKNGEKFTFDDFTKSLNRTEPQRSLLDSAQEFGGIRKIFSFETWQGRFDEMEMLWYKVPVPVRREAFKNDGLLDLDLKRRLFAAEGREMPEDRLAKSGLSVADIRQGFAVVGAYEELNRHLKQSGDYLRKEYLLLPDRSGYTMFCDAPVWNRYEDIVKNLQEKGDRFEMRDFLRQVGNVPNMLMRAFEKGSLNKVFTPAHWEGRLPEMLELWSHVKDGWKISPMTVSDFDKAYAEAESLTCGKEISFKDIESKAALLRRIGDSEPAVIPLGIKAFWDHYAEADERLKTLGEKITLGDLRQKSGHMGNSCLMSAAKLGHFAKAAEISRQSGEALTLDDFLAKDCQGNTMLNILTERGELGMVFTPDLWAGRLTDMKTLWTHVRVADRQQIDMQQVEVAVRQATLKMQAKNNFKFQTGPKGP